MPTTGSTEVETLIDKRYLLGEQIGAGGMSEVYRAVDRLTGQEVALKRVLTEGTPDSSAKTVSDDVRLALAQEFRLLASLRHPHIISVLDYGFDDSFEGDISRQPYFTMDLLEGALTILEAGQGRSIEEQVNLLVQMLQALTYLHRRGVIHRDLKPTNVLVCEGEVKLLDFGLSVRRDQTGEEIHTAGTLAYMPPEILQGQPADMVSDLYAAGLIGFELFAGHHPFDTTDMNQLLQDIFHTIPDFNLMDAPVEAARVVAQLLAKEPVERYESAEEVIAALCGAVGQPIPAETAAIRESFLQSARLVGRDDELAQLTGVLIRAMAGSGAAWLVGGESGVGKTRFVDELRAVALVRGAFVLRGQTISTGGIAYQLWRPIVRWLCLAVEITPREASILQTVVPDIDTLLDQPVEDVPELEPLAAQNRLHSVVIDLFRRLHASGLNTRPVQVILEDLHWASSEELTLLERLSLAVDEMPVMLVATYRDEERPDLPELLPNMELMKLERLDTESIAELGESMLGPSGKRPQVIDLIRRETEGNVFFIVEVVRVLAEEAGRLDLIGTRTLPEHVFAGGVQRVVQRRLNLVPAEDHELLRVAAVLGRELDLDVLRVIAPDADVDRWLQAAADAAVLEVEDTGGLETRWRFAHDKLREGLLNQLDTGEEQALHVQVAQGLETVYGDDPRALAEHSPALVLHWAEAGNREKERRYAILAGEQAVRTGAYAEAIAFLSRALTLHDEIADTALERAQIQRRLGQAYLGLGNISAGQKALLNALELLGYGLPVSERKMIFSLLREGAVQVVRLIGLPPGRARGRARRDLLLNTAGVYEHLAEIFYFANDSLPGIYSALKALNLAERAGPSPELARSYANMCVGMGVVALPLDFLARAYSRRALRVVEQISDPSVRGYVLLGTGIYYAGVGEWAQAESNFREAVEIYRSVGDIKRLEQAYTSLGHMDVIRGNYARAIDWNREVYESADSRGDDQMKCSALLWQAAAYIMLWEPEEASDLLEEAYPLFEDSPDVGLQIVGYAVLAITQRRTSRPEEALETGKRATRLMEQSAPTSFSALPAYAGLVGMYLNLWAQDRHNPPSGLIEAVQKALKGLELYSRTFPIGWPITWLWKGTYEWLHGNESSAWKCWEKALDSAVKSGNPAIEARAHFHIGRYGEDGVARREHLQKARDLFIELGGTYEVERIDHLLTGE